MNRSIRTVVRSVGALAVAGGTLLALALPAAAASPNTAYGALATGAISDGPIGQASFPGTSPVTVSNASILGLFTAANITDTATSTTASSTISDAGATLGALAALTATSITSSCAFNTNTGAATGTSGINNGSVTVGGLPAQGLPANPAPNTVIGIPGIATITLNEQTTATDGTLTVTAIDISLAGGAQTLTLGVSVCNAADLAPVPVLPGKALTASIGGLGLLGLGVVGYQIRRRHGVAAA
jgi:hypothetical protein